MKKNHLLLLVFASIFLISFYKPAGRKSLNEEQVLILKKAASELNFKIQDFKTQSSKFYNTPGGQDVNLALRDSLFIAAKEVKKIQNAFVSASDNKNLCSFSRNFFNDISYKYDDGQDSLINNSKTLYDYDNSYKIVLSALEYNYKAYIVVAEEKVPQFDLYVTSVPDKATIYYRKKGDTKPNGIKMTNTTIKNLDYCTWIFTIHIDGYTDQERIFNPYDEVEKVLDFGTLKSK